MLILSLPLFRLFLCSTIIVFSGFTYSDELSFAFGKSRPPFIYLEGDTWRGFEYDIVFAALEYKGHKIVNKEHMSNKRLAIAVVRGFDGAATVQVIEGDGTYYSDNFIKYVNYAVSRAEDKLKIESIQDLTNYSPAAWQNAYINLGAEFGKYFGPEAKGNHLRNYKEFVNQSAQNRYFWRGRANVILVDKSIFLWFKKLFSKELNTNVEVMFHDVFQKEAHYKCNFKSEKIRDDFNEGLKYLRESGRYQEIIDQYLK